MPASFGNWPANTGGGASVGALTPVCVVQLRLGSGTEGITSQVGDVEVVVSLNVVDVGEYELTLNAEAGIIDPDALYIIATAGDFVPRIVVAFPTLPTIALNVYDAAGVHQPIGRVWLAFYYNSELPPS